VLKFPQPKIFSQAYGFEGPVPQVNLPSLDKDFYKKLWEETLKLSHENPYIKGGVII